MLSTRFCLCPPLFTTALVATLYLVPEERPSYVAQRSGRAVREDYENIGTCSLQYFENTKTGLVFDVKLM